MRLTMILPFGGLPITSPDLGSWYPRVNRITEISLLNLNYEFWLFIASPKGMHLILDAGFTKENLNTSTEFRLEAESSLINLREQSTYSSISNYTQAIESIERYLYFLNKAQDKFYFSILYGIKINSVNYYSSTSIYEYARESSTLNKLLRGYFNNNFEADFVLVKVRNQFELVFATVLCKVIRDIKENIKICLVDHEYENFSLYKLGLENMLLKSTFDNIVLKDSEIAVPQLVEALKAQDNIPYILNKENVNIDRRDMEVSEEELLDLVVPKVRTFLPEYAVSTRLSNKACYWSKCSFCTHNKKIGLEDHDINKHSQYQHIRLLYNSGYKYFALNDEAINRADIINFAKWIMNERMRITWLFRTRLDCEFDQELIDILAASGCVSIGFGLESINTETLKSMNKYQEPPSTDYIKNLFEKLIQNNIMVHINLILGYPREKINDMAATIHFVDGLLRESTQYTFTLNRFVLFKETTICKKPQKFGIRIVESLDDFEMVQSYQMIDEEYSNKELFDFILQSHKRLWRYQSFPQVNNASIFLYNNTLHGIFLRL
ncbi:MAG: B12-binding domain-containing radical SAM protein [Clostridia bacterium]